VIRSATASDDERLAAIYAPYVLDTAVSFEEVPPTAAQMGERRQAVRDASLPWLVVEEAGRVLGYAYASPHRSRAAYRFSVETTVYLATSATGRGLGRQLMESLLAELTQRGLALALAGVSLPNEASVALHRKLGFTEVGIYRGVGFKHGRWHDVWWGQRALRASR
jgi:phosphinothricin acetyltransferase